ncbi:MAG TPA: hypothetical protein VGJ82_13090 [Thermoanaerobaculia bacterium]|jgi:hypothetical protein
MELFLNAVWVVLAVTALTRLGRRSLAATLATICVLALLFPIISITDDLHARAAAVEETAKSFAVTTLVFAITVTLTLVGFTYQKPLTRFSAPVWRGLPARAP